VVFWNPNQSSIRGSPFGIGHLLAGVGGMGDIE
jgi:hypothetical protein